MRRVPGRQGGSADCQRPVRCWWWSAASLPSRLGELDCRRGTRGRSFYSAAAAAVWKLQHAARQQRHGIDSMYESRCQSARRTPTPRGSGSTGSNLGGALVFGRGRRSFRCRPGCGEAAGCGEGRSPTSGSATATSSDPQRRLAAQAAVGADELVRGIKACSSGGQALAVIEQISGASQVGESRAASDLPRAAPAAVATAPVPLSPYRGDRRLVHDPPSALVKRTGEPSHCRRTSRSQPPACTKGSANSGAPPPHPMRKPWPRTRSQLHPQAILP